MQEQKAEALRSERAKLLNEVQAITHRRRIEVIKSLTSFHVEGLSHSLREWDESEPTILGAFVWEPERGFLSGSTLSPDLADRDELVALWRTFREWRKQNPAAIADKGNLLAGRYTTAHFHLLANPELPPEELGYQSENLEMLAYAKRAVDPWAGWAGHLDDSRKPWVVWYQAGPEAPVRGCFVAALPLIEEIRREFADTSVARIQLQPNSDGSAPTLSSEQVSLHSWLPGWTARLEAGEIFAERENTAKFAVWLVALLLAVFLVGVAVLAFLSRREILDAERKTTFVTQVSHELRTPLTSIRMFADLLATPELSEEKRTKYAGSISRESERLSALIERLLAFSALERGRQRVAIEQVDIGPVLRETIDEIRPVLRAAGVELVHEVPADAIVAVTDASVVKQAVLNLLDNAAKYAATGKIARLAVQRTPGKVCVRVSDEGPGIPRTLGERVFEPFVQGNESLTGKSPGVGLGLSIARGLLRRAGADLVLVSSRVGACFEIQLPTATP
jgi:signal transduction histidine kinase